MFGADRQMRRYANAIDDGEYQIEQIEIVIGAREVGEENQVKHQTWAGRNEDPVQTKNNAYEVVVFDVLAAQRIEMFKNWVELIQIDFEMQILCIVSIVFELLGHVGETQPYKVWNQIQNQMWGEKDALYDPYIIDIEQQRKETVDDEVKQVHVIEIDRQKGQATED